MALRGSTIAEKLSCVKSKPILSLTQGTQQRKILLPSCVSAILSRATLSVDIVRLDGITWPNLASTLPSGRSAARVGVIENLGLTFMLKTSV